MIPPSGNGTYPCLKSILAWVRCLVAANPKSQKNENATTNEFSGSSMVLGNRGRGALVERAGVCFLRDPHFRSGSNDAILDGGSEAMGSIHPGLDLFRLRPGR